MKLTAAIITKDNILKKCLFDNFSKLKIKVSGIESASYVVVKADSYSEAVSFLKSQNFENKKVVIILPLNIFNKKYFTSIKIPSSVAITYCQEIFLPTNNIEVGIGESFYFIDFKTLSKTVIGWLLSFGPFGQESFILGTQLSSATVWKEFRKYNSELTLSYNKTKPFPRIPISGFHIERKNLNLSLLVKSLYPQKNIKSKKPTIKKIHSKIKFKFLKPFLIILVVFISIPLILLFLTILILFIAQKFYFVGSFSTSRNLLLASKVPTTMGVVYTAYVSKDLNYTFSSLSKIADIGVVGIELTQIGHTFLNNVLGDEVYDSENLSRLAFDDLKLLTDHLKNFEFITVENKNVGGRISKMVLEKVDFNKYIFQLDNISKILNEAPDILGVTNPKTYLLLFQNNMELRPTGGFIGSFGLMTMEGGRMTDLSVSDVYSADGQLKGHVEPPVPIKNYLGEANWYLRDSNWDPDFVTSAIKAEWFLEKEIDKKVDGVIAIDLDVAVDLLRYTGPIYLADYDMDITAENLYLKTQEEVHRDFFPGTHKKASFLTALSRNLVTEVIKLGKEGKLGIIKELYFNLQERHIQIYLHNKNAGDAISRLMWSGEVKTPSCGEQCYPDSIGVIEANVGVNKANYFIKRSFDLKVYLLPSVIRRELTLTLRNEASPSLGLPGKYKVHIRFLTANGEQEFIEEIVNGETKEIRAFWETPTDSNLSYGIYFRKQAGTGEDDPLQVSIVAPDRVYSYNTTLAQDFNVKIPWTYTH